MEPSPVVIAALTKANIDKNSLSFLGSDEILEVLNENINNKTISVGDKMNILGFWRSLTKSVSSSVVPTAAVHTQPAQAPITFNFDGAQFGTMHQHQVITVAPAASAPAIPTAQNERQPEKKKAVTLGPGYEIATVSANLQPKNGRSEMSSNDRFIGIAKGLLAVYEKKVPTLADKNVAWNLTDENVQAFANGVWKKFCDDNELATNCKNVSVAQRADREIAIKKLIGEIGDDLKLETTVLKGSIIDFSFPHTFVYYYGNCYYYF